MTFFFFYCTSFLLATQSNLKSSHCQIIASLIQISSFYQKTKTPEYKFHQFFPMGKSKPKNKECVNCFDEVENYSFVCLKCNCGFCRNCGRSLYDAEPGPQPGTLRACSECSLKSDDDKGKVKEAEEWTGCEVCHNIENEDKILLCDNCDKGEIVNTLKTIETFLAWKCTIVNYHYDNFSFFFRLPYVLSQSPTYRSSSG